MLRDLQQVLNAYWEQFLYLSPKLLIAFVVIVIAFFIANRLGGILSRRLHGNSHDPLLADFLARIAKWALLLVGLLLAMQVVGLSGVVSGLLGGAAVSAFVVGFALKDIAENFLAGMVLAFNRPFSIHDTVQIRDLIGHVEALNLRTTVIKTFDGKHIFLPNAMVLREPLTNFTRDGAIRQDFLVSVDYGEEPGPDRVIGLLLSYVDSVEGVQTQAPRVSYVTLEKTAGTSADLRVYFWTHSEDYRRRVLELKSDLMKGAKQLLADSGYPTPTAVQ